MKESAKKQRSTTEAADRSAENELEARMWSVVSFERREASGLTYAEAVEKSAELEWQKVAGLCIVTDEAAGRVADT
jgi:hypothetical protein